MLSIFLLAVVVVLFVLLVKEKITANNLETERDSFCRRVNELEREIANDNPRDQWMKRMFDQFVRCEVVPKLPGFRGNFKEYRNEGSLTYITSTTGKTVCVKIGGTMVPSEPKAWYKWMDEEEAIIACGGMPKDKKPEGKKPTRKLVYDNEEGKNHFVTIDEPKDGEQEDGVENAVPIETDATEAALQEFYKELNSKLLALYMEEGDDHFCFDIPEHLSGMKDRIWDHITQNEYCVGENNTEEPGQYIVLRG